MLEGKEVDVKLGDVGSLTVDVQANGHLDIAANLDFKKEVLPGLEVFHKSSTGTAVKLVTLVSAQAAKSNSKILKLIAGALAKLDAGEEVHADVVAALEAHVTPVA
jgi:hypothetical protein